MTRESPLVSPELSAPVSRGELLTEQFYAWERRGRGWQVWDYPVEIEPPYRPFFHFLPALGAVHDDGRTHTLVSALVAKIRESFTPAACPEPVLFEIPEPDPEFSSPESPLVEIQVSVPPTLKISRDATEQFLVSLSYASWPASFEVIGLADSILVHFVCHEDDRTGFREQLRAHFPEAVLTEEADFLSRHWERAGGKESAVVDFGLSREFMLPLRSPRGFETDPLTGVVGAIADLRAGELGALQVLFQATRYPWAESIGRAVRDGESGAFFADAPEMVPLARDKVRRPLFAAVVRVAAQSPTPGRAWQIARGLGSSLAPLSSPSTNELIPLANDDYDEVDHQDDLLFRRTHRTGMILNSEELASLVHLPSASVRSEKLKREARKTKAAPAIALAQGALIGDGVTLGENVHAGATVKVALTAAQRIMHTYVIGVSGTGKSTLLLNLIVQDIEHGDGIAVLDPHGDLIDEVLGRIPEERHKDVVLFDPSDADWPVGFNILSAHSELERQLMASDMVAVFRRLSTSWGDQMTSVLGNAVLAFLESERGGTVADLRRFLVEPGFRKAFLATVRDPEIVYYWEREFPLLVGRPQAPILTRLDTFLRPKLVRHMVCQRENRLDFARMMNEGKIFLGKLAQGAIGEENAYLLGTLIVSKFHQIALARQEIAQTERRNFYLYIDEFHNFVTPSMAAILSGARKYRLGLVLAHQDLRQILRDDELLGAVLSNPYTRVCFRVGDDDARKLEDGFSTFDAKDLQNLGTGQAICRIERAEYDFNLKTLLLPSVEPGFARERRDRIVMLSREKYATPRDVVEAALRAAAGPAPEEPAAESRAARTQRPVAERAVPAAGTAPAQAPETWKSWTPPRAAPPRPAAPSTPGRGGAQHKYLQELIKRWAESRGWRATIEKQVLDGLGSVDVALEKGELSVACEICVGSTPERELGNLQKCLAARFEHVVEVSSEPKVLRRVRDFVSERLSEQELTRVRFLSPEELFALFETLKDEMSVSTEQTARGYKVTRRYRPVAESEQKSRRRAISHVLLQTIKRIRRVQNGPA